MAPPRVVMGLITSHIIPQSQLLLTTLSVCPPRMIIHCGEFTARWLPFIVKDVSYLWYVQAGLEEEIVFALLQTVYPRHEIRSAFANGLVVRGWVYMEATMNNHLQQLLRITPGILRNHYGICIQLIPFNEGMELLKMHSKDPLESGKWVQVRRGHYKGDVGYILSVAASEVHLLLIPRVAPDASRSKKKRRTTLELFNHETDEMLAAEVDV